MRSFAPMLKPLPLMMTDKIKEIVQRGLQPVLAKAKQTGSKTVVMPSMAGDVGAFWSSQPSDITPEMLNLIEQETIRQAAEAGLEIQLIEISSQEYLDWLVNCHEANSPDNAFKFAAWKASREGEAASDPELPQTL